MKSDLAVTLVVLMISVCLAACDDPVTSAEVALASPLNHFAVTLFQKVSSEPDNVVISPFSLATALSMLLLGARGETKSLIQSKLNLDNVPNSDGRSIHQLFHDVS